MQNLTTRPDEAATVPAPVGLDLTDPANTEFAVMLRRDVPIEDVLAARGDVAGYLESVEAQLKAARWRLATLSAIAVAKMQDKKAQIVEAPSTGWRMLTKRGAKQTQQRLNVLQKLGALTNANGDPLIPPETLKKAIWLDMPEPQWKTHLTYLRKLGVYGEEVQAIIAEGIVETEGPETVVFERIDPPRKNVTPIKGGI